MKRHVKDPRFQPCLERLPPDVQATAQRCFRLLRDNPRHPSLKFKNIRGDLWSVRIGLKYRALALEGDDTFHWFFIGTHGEYDQLLSNL